MTVASARSGSPGHGLAFALALLFALLFAAPLLLALSTSLKSPAELKQVFSLPSTPYWHNYAAAIDRMGRSFVNSLLITGPAVVFSIAIGAIGPIPWLTRADAAARSPISCC